MKLDYLKKKVPSFVSANTNTSAQIDSKLIVQLKKENQELKRANNLLKEFATNLVMNQKGFDK